MLLIMADFVIIEERAAKLEWDHYADLRQEKHPVLPSNVRLGYLAEGAANIVYTIDVLPLTPAESDLPTYRDGTPPPTETEFSWEQQQMNDHDNIWVGGESFS